MELASEIKRIAEAALQPGQFIVDVEISAKKGPKKVLVLVDGDSGINIDECAEISRAVSKVLDERSLIDDAYMLEVSTPGVDYPLKLDRQFVKNIGRKLKIRLKDGAVAEGVLSQYNAGVLTIEEIVKVGKKSETRPRALEIAAVDKAVVMVSFK